MKTTIRQETNNRHSLLTCLEWRGTGSRSGLQLGREDITGSTVNTLVIILSGQAHHPPGCLYADQISSYDCKIVSN